MKVYGRNDYPKGMRVAYEINCNKKNQEKIESDIRGELSRITKKMLKIYYNNHNNSFNEINYESIVMQVRAIARRDLKEKYVGNNLISEERFKSLLQSLSTRAVEYFKNELEKSIDYDER